MSDPNQIITPDCDADTQANSLYTSLIQDAPVPPVVDLTNVKFDFKADLKSDLYSDVSSVTLEELTTKCIEGPGVFDTLMASVDLHIKREFKSSRITGDQYAKVYTDVMTTVLAQSTNFLLNKDKARWDAITAQMQGRIAEIGATAALVDLERAKIEAAKLAFDMSNSGAQFGLTKMQIVLSDAQYCLTKMQTAKENFTVGSLMPAELATMNYNLDDVLPSTVAINKIQSDRLLPAQAAISEFQNRDLQPVELQIAQFNRDNVLVTAEATAQFNLNSLLPVQLAQEVHKQNFQLPAQTQLLDEQKEVQRAQTMNTRSDALTIVAGVMGRQSLVLDEQRESERSKTLDTRSDTTTIVGSVGKQKDLFTQQIDSFKKDAQHKTAKMYLDGWITQKTLDEGLPIPLEMQETAIQAVLAGVRSNNEL